MLTHENGYDLGIGKSFFSSIRPDMSLQENLYGYEGHLGKVPQGDLKNPKFLERCKRYLQIDKICPRISRQAMGFLVNPTPRES